MAAMTRNHSHHRGGPSTRQLRVGEFIRRKLSDVLMHGDVHDPDLNRMSITVAEVRVSADLRIATVYVMPLGGGHREEAIAALARHTGELRHHVGKATGLKHTPELRFLIDDTFDQMEATRRLFDNEAVQRDLGRDEEE